MRVWEGGDILPGREVKLTKIDGIEVEDYIISVEKGGYVKMDITALNEALNSSAECSTLNCTTRVAGHGICQSCFMAALMDNKVWLDSRKGYVRMDKEFRYYG